MIINIFLFFLFLNIKFTQHASINNLTKNDCTYTRLSTYSYNPCYPFSEEPTCLNVAICQTYRDESVSFVLGLNSWSVTADGKVTLVYSTIDRQTLVNLVCSQTLDQLFINGEYEHNHYNLTLSSKCACWNEC